MHQQHPDGYSDVHAPDDAQQPTYGALQGINAYPTTTRMVPDLEYVGYNEDTHRAYASTSHSGTRQVGPGMQIGPEGWAHQPVRDSIIHYHHHPQVPQHFSDFGSQACAALTYPLQAPDPSLQYPRVSYPPGDAMYESWQAPDSRRISSPAALPPTMQSHWPTASGHSYSNPVNRPPTSPLSSPSSTTSGTYTELPIQSPGENFIQDSFPGKGSEHESLRLALTEVMNAPWKRKNKIEPDEDLLLQFQSYDKREGKWKCRFSSEGRPCQCSTKKKDHAKGHIRWHIDHRPYLCQNPCPAGDANCTKQYTAMESLKKHQNGKADCGFCGTSMLKGNLQRHVTSSCKGSITPG